MIDISSINEIMRGQQGFIFFIWLILTVMASTLLCGGMSGHNQVACNPSKFVV